MSNSNETSGADSNNINTRRVIVVICFIVLVVVGFYFFNFHYSLSEKNEVWGTFGDYFGGILNPVIAAFAFYLIAKTYELQKRELEATRSLLEVSTDAQKNQIKLAELTALLNSNLTRIGLLKSEKAEFLKETLPEHKNTEKVFRSKANESQSSDNLELLEELEKQIYDENYDTIMMVREIDREINNLTEKNNELEKQIEVFLEGKQNAQRNKVKS